MRRYPLYAIACSLIPAVSAHPEGYNDCSLSAPRKPPGNIVDEGLLSSIAVSCDKTACSMTADTFKGFVLAVAPGSTILSYNGTGIRRSTSNADHCLTHVDRDTLSRVDFTLSALPATVHVTVVTAGNWAAHTHAYKTVFIPRDKGHAYIIGAGPGGLAAARYFHHINMTNYTVFERGPWPDDNFFNISISDTYLSRANSSLKYNVLNSSEYYNLGTGVGGTQNLNGAVYKPGTPEDLAASTKVSVDAARSAQTLAGTFVDHTDYNMTWACIDQSDCDSNHTASLNTQMARRSIAYDLPGSIKDRIRVNTAVERVHVSNTGVVTISFEYDDDIILTADDAVILAAGALASPVLLFGKDKEFTGHNHYYTTDFPTGEFPYAHQTFEYSETHEYNYADFDLDYSVFPPTPTSNWINISMEMEPIERETHQYNKAYSNPSASGIQSWHFAGTMPHTNFRVDGISSRQVYTGDAGALLTPFNCHTSMPAAAAGIMAAKSWMGLLEDDNTAVAAERRDTTPIYLFITAIFLVLLGVAFHRIEYTRRLHYIIMPLSIVLIWAAIILIQRNKEGTSAIKDTAHYDLGYVIASVMTFQGILGLLHLYAETLSTIACVKAIIAFIKGRHVHTRLGYLLLLLIIAQVWTARNALMMYFSKTTTDYIYFSIGTLYTVASLAFLAIVGYNFTVFPRTLLGASFADDGTKTLLL